MRGVLPGRAAVLVFLAALSIDAIASGEEGADSVMEILRMTRQRLHELHARITAELGHQHQTSRPPRTPRPPRFSAPPAPPRVLCITAGEVAFGTAFFPPAGTERVNLLEKEASRAPGGERVLLSSVGAAAAHFGLEVRWYAQVHFRALTPKKMAECTYVLAEKGNGIIEAGSIGRRVGDGRSCGSLTRVFSARLAALRRGEPGATTYIWGFFGMATPCLHAHPVFREQVSSEFIQGRLLAAHDTPTAPNRFIGYIVDPAATAEERLTDFFFGPDAVEDGTLAGRPKRGLLYGKLRRYLVGTPPQKVFVDALLRRCRDVEFVTIADAGEACRTHANLACIGPQRRSRWLQLLGSVDVLVGLGDPILGPSVIEAMSRGVAFVNPRPPNRVVNTGADDIRCRTQHDAAAAVGAPYVCEYDLGDVDGALACIRAAVDRPQRLPDYVVPAYGRDAYMKRFGELFNISTPAGDAGG